MRRLTLAILFASYTVVFVRLPTLGAGGRGFDPLDPRGRQVEQAIEETRFADALPVVRELESTYGAEPVVAYWLAEILRGLGQPAEEARAWERVLDLSGEADAACPWMPDAYGKSGDRARALGSYERCAAAAPDDPERWLDLGAAYAAQGRGADAERAYATSRALDPSNPRLPIVRAGAEPPQVTGP